jgi:hypothetical protein
MFPISESEIKHRRERGAAVTSREVLGDNTLRRLWWWATLTIKMGL